MTPRNLSERYWRSATGKADRVLIAVVVAMAALAGTMFGLSHAVTKTHIVHMMDKIVEYIHTPVPLPAPEAIASRDASSYLLAQHRCLAEAIYYEARGEGVAGEKAVAEVVLNRLHSGRYGGSICRVVYEGVQEAQCQFSFACDGARYGPKSPADWRSAGLLAARILTGEEVLANATGEATNYHAAQIRPAWANRLVLTAQIGNHIFYRQRGDERQLERAALRPALD